jgi:uncharacterized protein (TIGR02001 family)
MQHRIKKSIVLGVGLIGLTLSSQATQAAELTANVGVTSNYVFRGLTQTDDGVALQGGVDYVHEAGVYAGAWASNVELSPGDKGYETDLYAGYNFKLNENVTFDVGYIAYLYSSTNGDPDADEIYFGAAFKDVSVTYYSGNRDVGADYSYIDLKYSMALPSDFNLHLHYGNMNDDAAGGDYQDAAIGVSKNIEGFDVGLTITTIDHDTPALEDDEVFITVSKAFNLM